MMVIISDASPLHYLALIAELHLLPLLFGRIVIPPQVFAEIQPPHTPDAVKAWAAAAPAWLEVRAVSMPIAASLSHLDRGEQEAITLALELQAETLLIDEAKGRDAAELHGLHITGTLGVLYAAAEAGWCDLAAAFAKLQQTNFRASTSLYQYFLTLHAQRP